MNVIVFDQQAFLVLGLAGGLGLVGGLLRWWTTEPRPTPAQGTRHGVVGALAGLGTAFVARPVDAVGLVAASLIAGWAGEAVLAALEVRAKLVIAEATAKTEREKADKAKGKLDEAEADLDLAIAELDGQDDAVGQLMGSGAAAPGSPSVVAQLIARRDARRRVGNA